MQRRRKAWGWVLGMGCLAAAGAAPGQTLPANLPAAVPARAVPPDVSAAPAPGFSAAPVPLEQLPPQARERVASVLAHPTLSSRGPLEAFRCRPGLYYWLLDHPDLAVRLWHGLGARCADIQGAGDGGFVWKDANNGEVHWYTVLRTARQRVWYAEGRVRPGTMLPSVSLRAVVVLNHQEGSDGHGRPAIRHQMDMVLHTDSRAVGLATRLFGASAPRLAEEYVGQLEMFFGALAWYLTEHPDKATALFNELKQSPGIAAPPGPIMPTSAQSVP